MFVLNKIIIAVVSPLGTALLLGVLALVAAGLKQRKIAVWLGAFAILWIYLWSTPVMSYRLQSWLEEDYPPVKMQAVPKADAIVVLGGGMRPPTRSRPSFDLGSAADRVWHALRLYAADKAPLIILSGGHESSVSLTSEAEAMGWWLVEAGIPTEAILLEGQSRTTAENAAFTAPLLKEKKIKRVLLVTSATHMRRARAFFEAEGLEIIPAATDHEAEPPPPGIRAFLPHTERLDDSAKAFKEVVAYRFATPSPKPAR